MNIMENSGVKEFIALDEKRPCLIVTTVCQCIQKNMPLNAHAKDVKPYSKNLAELALNGSSDRSLLMYISKTSYLDGDTMKVLVYQMLDCKDEGKVFQYYNLLDQNFRIHPPCAPYMTIEYEDLILTPYKNFREMSLWDYIIDYFNCIVSGSYLYGENQVFDEAFKKCLTFCVCILQINYKLSKSNNFRPLIMKCLKFNPERRTRLTEITKLLDTLINKVNDFQLPVVNLAILVNQLLIRPK